MKIALGADPFGLDLKELLKAHLAARGHELVDVGGGADAERPYYDVAHDAATRVARGEVDRAILCCGSGMGMAIVANKHRGVYAAVCEDPSAARGARAINDANVLTLGARITAAPRAAEIADAFLETAFTSGIDGELKAFLERSKGDIDRIESEAFGG